MTQQIKLPPLPYPQMPGNDYTASDMHDYARAAVKAALQSQDREDDPLQPAADWLLRASPDSFPNATELQAHLMIGYNRAKRLFDHARRVEGGGE